MTRRVLRLLHNIPRHDVNNEHSSEKPKLKAVHAGPAKRLVKSKANWTQGFRQRKISLPV